MNKNYLYLFFVLSFIIGIGLASNGTKIRVDDYISLTDYPIGSEFNVSVYIDGFVTNLSSYEFNLSWNPNVLELLNITTNESYFWPIPPPDEPQCYVIIKGTDEDFNSTYIACEPQWGRDDNYTGPGGTLATLRFKVNKTGFNLLTFNRAYLYDVDVDVISNESQSGIFINIDEPVPLNLRHEEEVITILDDVNISVEWFDFYDLQKVTIFENSTGDWISHDVSG
jgi:hypothetical protein